jgi:predicted FMN-binding regulatory protein PaiB
MLSKLIAQIDPAYQAQFDAMDPELSNRMISAIVGFEMKVDKLEGKFKLDQHRLGDMKAEMRIGYEHGNDNERGIVDWMKRLGYWSA